MKSQRILFAHPGAELYGSDRMGVQTVDVLQRDGAQVIVVLPNGGPLEGAILSTGAQLEIRNTAVLRKSILAPKRLLGTIIRVPRDIARAMKLIRGFDADTVYVNTITQPWFMIAAYLLRKKLIVHVREAESSIPVWQQRILLAPVSLASTIVCNSKATQDSLRVLSTKARARSLVLYNGKDWSRYFTSEYRTATAPFEIVVVGRLSPRKGQDLVLRAVAILREEGFDVGVTFVGDVFPGYEWFEQQLVDLAEELDLGGNTTFAGFASDAAPYLAAADIVVVPSREEPFGSTALEGMGAMRPVVASSVQGLREVVQPSISGLLFEPNDEKSLAAACRLLLADPQLAERLARAGAKHAADSFSLENYSRDTLSVVGRGATPTKDACGLAI